MSIPNRLAGGLSGTPASPGGPSARGESPSWIDCCTMSMIAGFPLSSVMPCGNDGSRSRALLPFDRTAA
jgi:hypothetical protein